MFLFKYRRRGESEEGQVKMYLGEVDIMLALVVLHFVFRDVPGLKYCSLVTIAVNEFYSACLRSKLKVNVGKSKVMVF